MWWTDVMNLGDTVATAGPGGIDPTAVIEPGAILNETGGPITVGARTRICAGAIINGPVVIGANCLVGNYALVRAPSVIEDDVRIGYSCEIKQAGIAAGVRIGPMCFVSDSIIEPNAYLGALVRTSNHRLDGAPVSVRSATGEFVATGLEKLGCLIGTGTTLGIQVIILPGRVVPPNSLFEPRITIARNHPPGRYLITQTLECY